MRWLRKNPDRTITEKALYETYGGVQLKGKVVIKDRIADMLFQQVLLRPEEFHVIAAPDLNGDYLSDSLSAQTGGPWHGARRQYRGPLRGI